MAKKKAPAKKVESAIDPKDLDLVEKILDSVIRAREQSHLGEIANLKTAIEQRNKIIDSLADLLRTKWRKEENESDISQPFFPGTDGDSILSKDEFCQLADFVGTFTDSNWVGAKSCEKFLARGCGVKPVKPEKIQTLKDYLDVGKALLKTFETKSKKK